MPLRAPKMYCFIFGFQRFVWCPKWTPASRSCFMVMAVPEARAAAMVSAAPPDTDSFCCAFIVVSPVVPPLSALPTLDPNLHPGEPSHPGSFRAPERFADKCVNLLQ